MNGNILREMFDCIPELDFQAGYRYFLGSTENYSRALMSTLKSIKSKLPLLESMYYTEEYEGLRTITRTLRKMLGNIGALSLAEASYRMESALFGDTSLLQERLADYMDELTVLSEHLETLLQSMFGRNITAREESNSSFLHYDFTKTRESIRKSTDLLERKII